MKGNMSVTLHPIDNAPSQTFGSSYSTYFDGKPCTNEWYVTWHFPFT